MLAEAARLRESQADLWPKFFIAAVLGRKDLRLNGLDLSPVRYSNVALAFTAPLFNAGRLRAAVERQSARQRTATLQYERAEPPQRLAPRRVAAPRGPDRARH